MISTLIYFICHCANGGLQEQLKHCARHMLDSTHAPTWMSAFLPSILCYFCFLCAPSSYPSLHFFHFLLLFVLFTTPLIFFLSAPSSFPKFSSLSSSIMYLLIRRLLLSPPACQSFTSSPFSILFSSPSLHSLSFSFSPLLHFCAFTNLCIPLLLRFTPASLCLPAIFFSFFPACPFQSRSPQRRH